MKGSKRECEADPFYHQDESATSSSYASPAHRLHSSQQHDRSEQPREPQPVELPEVRVVNVKEPTKSYDGSFYCIHTSIEIVVVISLICATSELVLGFWVLFVLSRTSNHTSSSKYITIGVGMFIAESVRVYALLTWMKSSKQELMKAYSATTLCTVVSILVLLPIACLVLFVAVVVFEFVLFHIRPQAEVLQAFMLVAGFDIIFSICYGSMVACCFQSRLQQRQIYLRNSQINIRPLPPPPTTVNTTPSACLSVRNQTQHQYSTHYNGTYENSFYDEHLNPDLLLEQWYDFAPRPAYRHNSTVAYV